MNTSNWFLSAKESNKIELLPNGDVTILGHIYIGGGDKAVKITSNNYPYTISLQDYQYLYLDITDFNEERTHDNVYDKYKLKKGYLRVSNNPNNLVLTGFYKQSTTLNNDIYSWTGLFSKNRTKQIITDNSSFNNLVYKNGVVKFSDDLRKCTIYSELELMSRDRKIVKINFSSYPYELTISNGKSLVLDLTKTVDDNGNSNVIDNYQYTIYNETSIKEVLNYQHTYHNKILLLSQQKYANGLSFGAGIIFDTFYNKNHDKNLRIIGNNLSNTSKLISKIDLPYAHVSQIYVKKVGFKVYRFIVYQADDINPVESAITSYARLVVQDNSSNEVLFDDVICRKGQVYGSITIPNSPVLSPSMFDMDNGNIRVIVSADDTSFYRDFNINSLSFISEGILQITIKNDATPVNCNSNSFKQHLENTYGDTSEDYNNLIPLLIINDRIEKIDGIWYTPICFSNTYDYTGKYIMLMSSSDNGNTWRLHKPIENIERKYGEMTATFTGGKWHAIMRGNNGSYMYSNSENGEDWTVPVSNNIIGRGQRHSVAKTKDKNGNDAFIVSYRKYNDIQGHRTLMGIALTYDFQTYTDIAQISARKSAHYPSTFAFQGILHMTYTTGLKGTNRNDRDSIMFVKHTLFNI